MSADLIIVNASVVTMDENRPFATAVAVAGKQILAIGSDADILALKGPETRIINGRGGSLLPGFVESHMHLFSGAYGQTLLQLGEISGLDAMSAAVKAFAEANPDAGLLFAQGAGYEILGPGTRLDRHVLDSMCADWPLAVMSYDFHTLFANTAALEAAGLMHGLDLPPGNEVVMGADGLATGELREKFALIPVLELRTSGGREMLGMSGIEPDPAPTPEQWREDIEILKSGLKYCAMNGITSIHNMDGNRHVLELLRDVEAEGELLCRVEVPFHYTREMALGELDRAVAMHRDFASEKLKSGRVKIFVDGVIESGTAALVDDYADRPGLKGDPIFDAEAFREAAVEIDRLGLQISVHAIGDAAVRITLDGYEAAQKTNGKRDSRHRIEHIEMIQESDIPRFADLGVIASMQPLHAPVSHSGTVAGIGHHRMPLAYAWKRLVDAGAPFAFSSDWPVVPLNPLVSIQAAMTRPQLDPTYPDHRLSLRQTLEAYTWRGAYTGFLDHCTGRIREGMLADLVLLSGDIECVAHSEIAGLKPVLTVCDGQITYDAVP